MKKILLATTILTAGASMAAADITLSGYGRFGLQYNDNRGFNDIDEDGVQEVGESDLENLVISHRLRLNIDATTETDTGLTFGARLRMQNNDGDEFTAGNNTKFWVEYNGLNVSVGNVDTAFDSVGLTYNSEMGYEDSSFGDAQSSFYAYESQDMSGDQIGVAATYSISGVNLYMSYIDPNQYLTDVPAGVSEELGVAADYTFGAFTVAAAYTENGAGEDGNDMAFIGGAYAINDVANVGLNYYTYEADADVGDVNAESQVTLYGNYTMGATTLRAYVSDLDNATDTAYGIGADYKLADGVRLSGSVQSGFEGESVADMGVRFNF